MSVERNYLSKAEHDNYPTSGLGEKMWVAKDIEDLNRTICLREAAEGYEAKRTREDCDGAGSSNDKPHPKRIARLLEIMAHGNSYCEESSEYKDCSED